MRRYFIRSVKYLIAICALYWALVALGTSTSQLPVTVRQYFDIMFSTWKGWTLLVGTVVLAATYPRFGFVSRRVACDMVMDAEQIASAFRVEGYEMRGEENGVRSYRVVSPLSRLVMLGEDELRIWQDGDEVVIEGLRRTGVKVSLRLEGYISHKRREE